MKLFCPEGNQSLDCQGGNDFSSPRKRSFCLIKHCGEMKKEVKSSVMYNGRALWLRCPTQEMLDIYPFWLYIIDILYNPIQRYYPMGEIKYLTREQQSKFLKTIDMSTQSMRVRDRLYFTLCLRYGLRATEGRLMKLSHLKLEQNSVYVERVKGGMSQFYPLREDDKKLIKKWLKQRDKLEHRDSPFLFITDRTPQWSRLLPVKLFEKYAKQAKIEGHTCHSLRHSTAVNLLDKNVDLYDIKMWLAHTSINSTMEYLKIGTIKTRKRMTGLLEIL